MKQILFSFLFFLGLSLTAQKEIDPRIISQGNLDALVSKELLKNKVALHSTLTLKNIADHKYRDLYIVRQRAFHQDVEIEGKDIAIAVKANGGDLVLSNHNLDGLNSFAEERATFSMDKALDVAKRTFEAKYCEANVLEQKLVYKEVKGNFILTFRISLNASKCVGYSIYYIDAQSGEMIDSIDKAFASTEKGSNRSSYVDNNSTVMNSPLACTANADLYLPDPTGTVSNVGVNSFLLQQAEFLGLYNVNGANIIPTSTAFYINNPTSLAIFSTAAVPCNGNYTFANTTANYRTTFAYVHLNGFLNYFNNITSVPGGIKFNANVPNISPNAFYSGSQIEYTTDAGYDAMAADLFHVAGGGADYYLSQLNNSINSNVRGGLLDYLAQSYEWGNSSQTNPICFNYGGTSILTERYTNAEFCNSAGFSQQEYLSSFLIKLRNKFTQAKIDKLVVLTADMLASTDNNNQKVAEKLFTVANTMMTSDFSCYNLVEMRKMIVDFFNPCYPTMALSNVIINDYWIKVNSGDANGSEPYWGGNGWESPDIWNTINGVAKAPEYNQPNVMNVRITNIGTGNCIPQKVMLYWSVNLTNQTWPTSWTTLPESSFLGEASIPQILPGQSITVPVPWTAPNPLDFGAEEIHFCVLARIVDQSDEVARSLADINKPEYTGPWSTDWNVRYFNGTAWRNMTLKKFSGFMINEEETIIKDGLILFIAGPSPLGPNPVDPSVPTNPSVIDFDINVLPQKNGETNTNPIGLAEELRDPLFFEKMDVFIKPLDDLIPLLQNCDGPCIPSESYELSHDGFYRLVNHNFKFDKVVLEEDKLYKILVKVKPKKLYDNCSFSIIQKNVKNYVFGGETYTFLSEGLKPRTDKPSSLDRKISIFPNPAKSRITLSIEDTNLTIASIKLVDISGKLIKSIALQNKLFNYDIDISELSSATYFLEVEFEKGEKSRLQFFKE